jgi:hypothetical protein
MCFTVALVAVIAVTVWRGRSGLLGGDVVHAGEAREQ